jgi:hypothetical protein
MNERAMWKSWIVCGFWSLFALSCTPRKMVESSETPPPAPPPPPDVHVSEIANSATPPAHVTKVVRVSQSGKPVTTLQTGAFRVFEGGTHLDGTAIEQRLLPREEVIAFHTILLLDLSPGVSKEGRSILSQSATRFVHELCRRQPVTVFAFDGSAHIRFIGEYPKAVQPDKLVVSERSIPTPNGSARNLLGAVSDGQKRLDARLKQYSRPIRAGNLVVFSTGPDQGGRIPEATLIAQLAQSQNDIYYVGLRDENARDIPQVFFRNGKVLSPDLSHLPEAFGDVTRLISSNMDGHYVLSYCSQARSGIAKVRIEIDVVSDELEVMTGAVESQYDASHFSTGCKTTNPSRFAFTKLLAKK